MRAKKVVKVVEDTNVLVSLLIGKRLAGLKDLLLSPAVELLSTPQLIEEIQEVTRRSHLAKYFSSTEAEEMISLLKEYSVSMKISAPTKPISRDKKDDYLLVLAAQGNADVLLTGDEDLLVLRKFQGTRILRPMEFLTEFGT